MSTMGSDPDSTPNHTRSWELKERMKTTRNEKLLSAKASSMMEVTRRDADDGEPDTRSTTKTKSLSHSLHSRPHPASGKRRIILRRDGSKRLAPKDYDQQLSAQEARKSDVFQSLERFDLNEGPREREVRSSGKRRSKSRRRKSKEPSRRKSHSTTTSSIDDNDDDDDDGSMSSLGSEQLDRGSLSSDMNFSVSGRSNASLDLSFVFSYHNPRDRTEIKTSASVEQWARFKLLGRTGLGNISLSREARTLVDRNCTLLLRAIKNVLALRDDFMSSNGNLTDALVDIRSGHLLDEVKETVEVPAEQVQFKRDPDTIELDPVLQTQLRDYVTVISCMYRDNPFHNFEHASHVLRGANKLISLLAVPEKDLDEDNGNGYGVTTDPWTNFSLLFSALIHDVDHSGVPNAQLIKEGSHIADAYKNRSVAEQNSIELAWNLLMEPCYKELREGIFLNPAELTRFRGLLVTAVMATDIADKELAALRKDRAKEVMYTNEIDTTSDLVSRKATFILETLIQAADVSHTMQPFTVYRKWNHKLYREMYRAFKSGRAEKDPTESWYKSDIGFFDFYIIPLAEKLVECGVLHRAAETLLKHAQANRRSWESKGEAIVAEYVAEANHASNCRPQISLLEMASRATDSDSDSDDSRLLSDGFYYSGESSGAELSESTTDETMHLRDHRAGQRLSFRGDRELKELKQKLQKIQAEKDKLPEGKFKKKKSKSSRKVTSGKSSTSKTKSTKPKSTKANGETKGSSDKAKKKIKRSVTPKDATAEMKNEITTGKESKGLDAKTKSTTPAKKKKSESKRKLLKKAKSSEAGLDLSDLDDVDTGLDGKTTDRVRSNSLDRGMESAEKKAKKKSDPSKEKKKLKRSSKTKAKK